MTNIKKLEAELWESADLLRQGSKLTSSQYCMPVLALLFLRYAYSRFKMVEAEILQGRPTRGGRVMPVEASDFTAKSALYLPREAQYDYLVNLPANIADVGLKTKRRLEIVRALATNPKLLLLDEPAAGMNPHETEDLVKTIRFIRDNFDMTILLIEHDMKFVAPISVLICC